ncbi:translocation/assembly module TamB domain-containing protein [Thermodesulfobacteriota bacterium]
MAPKTTIKYFMKWAFFGFMSLMLLMSILFGLIQTGAGKAQLKKMLATGLGGAIPYQIAIDQLDGLIPFDIRLNQITVSDSNGKWLQIESARLKWTFASLFRARLRINEISAEAIRLERFPRSHEKKEESKPGKPLWPPPLPAVEIERFSLGRLTLGEPILGEEAIFAVNGRVLIQKKDHGLTGYFHIERIEGPEAIAELNWHIEGVKPKFSMDLSVKEAGGGLFEKQSGFKTGPVLLQLKGQGPVESWKGHLSAKAASLGEIEVEMELAAGEGTRLTGDGRMTVGPDLLPPTWSPLLTKGSIPFKLDVETRGGKTLEIHHIDLRPQWLSLDLEGRLSLQENRIEGSEFNLEIEDLSFFKELVGEDLGGRMRLKGVLSGPFRKPRVSLNFSFMDPFLYGVRASKINGELSIEPGDQTGPFLENLVIKTQGTVDDPVLPEGSPSIPDRSYRWSLDSKLINPKNILIRELALTSDTFNLRFAGSLAPVPLIVKGESFFEINNVNRLSELLGFDFQGSNLLRARMEWNGKENLLSADFDGKMLQPGPLHPVLDALLQEEVNYAGHLEFSNSNDLSITGFQIKTKSVELGGGVFFDLAAREFQTLGKIAVSSLSMFSGALGKRVDGRLDLDFELKGPLSNPHAAIKAIGREIKIEESMIEQATINVKARNLIEKPQGNIVLSLSNADHTLRAQSAFSLDMPQLRITGLKINAPASEIEGNLQIDVNTRIVEGLLHGKSDDLVSLSPFLRAKVGGSIIFDLSLLKGSEGQNLTLDLKGNKAVSPFGSARAIKVHAQLKDVFQALHGAAEVNITAFEKADLHLHDLNIEAEGRLKEAVFALKANGAFKKGFDLRSRGSFNFQARDNIFHLEQFQGHFGEHPITLVQPMTTKIDENNSAIESASIQFGQGTIFAKGKFGARAIEMDIRYERLPLNILYLLGGPEVSGSVSGSIGMKGSPENPAGDMKLGIRDIKLKESTFQKFPPAHASADIMLRDGRVIGKLVLEGLAEKPVRGSFEVPITLSFKPLALALRPRGKWSAHVSSVAKLERIASFFPLEDQALSGRVTTELNLAGSMESPAVKGSLQLSEGTYEHMRSGSIIKDIQVNARMVDDKLVMEKAQATDGNDGELSATGWVRLIPAQHFPLELELFMNRSTLLRSDDLSITMDGNIKMTGSIKESLLSGSLIVGPAELRIPDRLPSEVHGLKVIEINQPVDQKKNVGPKKRNPSTNQMLDVTIEIPGRVFVRGRGLDSEWQGKLQIAGTTRAPIIKGNLSIIRGRYNFLGKPFSLTKGALAFGGSTPPAPTFDIIAQNRRSDLTTIMSISGTPTDFKLNIDSDPSLPSDEILSRLLFGRSVAGLTPIQALKLAQAVSVLSGGGGMDFMGRISQAIGLDQLDLSQSGEDPVGGAAVRAGKYLRDDIYVEMEQGLGPDSGKVSVEVELTPNISVESEVGIDAQGGIGVNWKWDY